MFSVHAITLPGRESRFKEPCLKELNPLVDDLVEKIYNKFSKKKFAFFGHRYIWFGNSFIFIMLLKKIEFKNRNKPVSDEMRCSLSNQFHMNFKFTTINQSSFENRLCSYNFAVIWFHYMQICSIATRFTYWWQFLFMLCYFTPLSHSIKLVLKLLLVDIYSIHDFKVT